MKFHNYTEHTQIFVLTRSNRRIRVPCDCPKKLDHYFEKAIATPHVRREPS